MVFQARAKAKAKAKILRLEVNLYYDWTWEYLCDLIIEFRLWFNDQSDYERLESYTEAIGLDLVNIWEPLKAYKLDSDLINLKL